MDSTDNTNREAEEERAKEREIDDSLVAGTQAGDRMAFDKLVERHRARVLRYCTGKLHNNDDAEEATQKTFLKAYVGIATYTTPGNFSGWLTVIAGHTCVDIGRKRTNQPIATDPGVFEDGGQGNPADSQARSGPAQIGSPSVSPPDRIGTDLEEALDCFLEAMSTLNDVDQLLLRLKYLEGYSGKEIATMLGCKESWVASRLSNAKKKVREALWRESPDVATVLSRGRTSERRGNPGHALDPIVIDEPWLAEKTVIQKRVNIAWEESSNA